MSNQPTLDGFVKYADGSKRWRVDGKYHRIDGPAIEYVNGDKAWWVDGKCHRTDGPAIEYANGNKAWWVNGKLHRLDGPAIEYANGDKAWYVNSKRHRTDGSAIEYANGDKYWYVNGLLHRLDGPAIEYVNGRYYKAWYIDNKELTEQEFNNKIKERTRFRKILKVFEKAAIEKSHIHLMESWHHPEVLKEYKIARRRLLKWLVRS